MHEGHQPDALGDFPEADILAGKDGTEIDLTTPEALAPALDDGEGPIVERMLCPSCVHVAPIP